MARLQGWHLLGQVAEMCSDISRATGISRKYGIHGSTVYAITTIVIVSEQAILEYTVYMCIVGKLGEH